LIDSLQKGLGGNFTHPAERLANRCEAWRLKGGALDIIKSDDGNVARDFAARVAYGAHRADCGNIIEGEQRGKIVARVQ